MRRAGAVLLGLAVLGLLLAAALLWPRARGAPARPGLVVVLVDASADLAGAPEWLPWARAELRRAASEAQAAGAELAVLSYAAGVATGFPPGAPADFLAVLDGRTGSPFDPGAGLARGATRLADALAAVEPLLADGSRPAGRLVLLAPPAYTDASPEAALARLLARGTALEVRAPSWTPRTDLGVLALELPARIEVGAPLVARARILVRHGAPAGERATLALECEQGGATRRETRALALPLVDGELELPLDFGRAVPGRNVVRARVALAGGPDLLLENDRAQASSTGGAARVVGIVARAPVRPAAEAWRTSLAGLAGLELRLVAPEELAAELDGLAALVSLDVAPTDLPAPLVEAFVRRGGGWLACAGWRFLAGWPGRPAEPDLAALLPCAPPREARPPREVVLLVDGSGSMESAFDGVRAAALELVGAALDDDRVSLRFFTQGLEAEHVLKERGPGTGEAARRAARELLALRVPSGTTYLLRSLRALPGAPEGVETLALLLSDGREREAFADAAREAATVRAELAARRTRLAVIALGEPEPSILGALAGGEDRVRLARTREELGAVLQRELAGERVREGELALRPGAGPPGSLVDEIVGPAPAGELPRLRRLVRASLRPFAEAVWLGPDDEPALSVARAGRGRTALCAALPAADWLAGPAAAEVWAPLLRWLVRATDVPPPRARLEGGRIELTGLAADVQPELHVRVLDLAGVEPPLALSLTPPSTVGADAQRTREGVCPERVPGHAAIRFAAASGEECVPLERGVPEEYSGRERRVPAAWLSATPAPAAGNAAPAAVRAHPAGPWVLALALACLFAAGVAASRGQGVRASGR